MVDVATLRVTLVTTGGYYSGLSVTSRGLVTARNTQLSPNEIFTVESGVVTQRTFINTEKLKVCSSLLPSLEFQRGIRLC